MTRQRSRKKAGLRAVQWSKFIRAPDAQLLDALYVPALSQAVHYDRCCAYFSSRVLSVAARGFGGFIQNLLALGDAAPKPAARLLVNEQLDPQDLAALQATGNQGKLIEQLLQKFKTPTNALEKNRLEMLAWMVVAGWLEVRVGIMRHTRGVSHAKFGLITDVHDDRLAFMGSDNETGASLVENYEELVVWTSWQDKEFTDYYCQRFNDLWEDRDENVTTLLLPDAVRLKLIKLAPEEPPQELRQDKKALAASMLWHFIAAAPYLPNGDYACDATALVDLWPHQRRVVDDTSRAFPTGRLLCDEVGMGKTIEAILVLRRLLSGRGVKRALLLVPAGLLKQWQDELREKGGLLVPRWENGYLYFPNGKQQPRDADRALVENDVLLLSREWARLENNRGVVLGAPVWDLVLLDEAHAARRLTPEEREFNSANLLLQLLRDLHLRRRARGILLLSATPMQTQPWEPWDLLAILGVGGKWMVEFTDIRMYYEGIAKLRAGGLDLPTATVIARLVADGSEFPAPPDGLSAGSPAGIAEALAFSLPDKQRRYADWLWRGSPLRQRMHRNTRGTLRQYHAQGLLELPPPNRDVRDEVFGYQEQAERDCYNAIEAYINERYDQLERERTGKGFVMTIYRRRAASSPLALRRSLQRRMEACDRIIHQHWLVTALRPEDEQTDARDLSDAGIDERIDPALPKNAQAAEAEKRKIESLLQQLEALGSTDSKLSKFWGVLNEVTTEGRSVLVFTEYTDTMEYLRDQLRPKYGTTLGCYCGDGGQIWNGKEWLSVSKADITERLADGRLHVLVCTDAASEGLNLQTASALINYDLPWNPGKVEQRIGRIDRIGQQQPCLPIRNLFLANSVDMSVYQALRTRCGLFEHFVGPMQPVLALARDALRRNLRCEVVDAFLAQLNKKADETKADPTVASTFSESDAVVSRPAHPPAARQDMETALKWLSEAGGSISAKQVKGQPRWRLGGLLKRTIEVTTDRETLERNANIEPLTVGSEVLDRLVDRLPLPASRVPLVLAEHSSGAYRCVEARWVQSDGVTIATSAKQLMELIQSWDGKAPAPKLVVQAQDNAGKVARQRVEQMKELAQAREEANLAHQLEAARLRLLRELARTLRCVGSGDLNTLLRAQLQGERNPDGRYHCALKLLGGFPNWTPENIADADQFIGRLSPGACQSRVALGSEIDAALNDPRWQAGNVVGGQLEH